MHSLSKLENDSIFSSQAIVSRGDKMESFSFVEVNCIQFSFVLKSVHHKKSVLYFVSLSGHRQNTNELRG